MSAADPIGDLLVRWEELRERGQEATPEELCRDRPEWVAELSRRIRALEAVNRLRVPGAQSITLVSPASSEGTVGPDRPRIEGYEVLEELGRGGMGVVYKARQLGLNRLVALKMILAGSYAAPAEVRRFESEAGALAHLQHPNIVQIHEEGEQDGRPFLVLEFVEGTSLDKALQGKPQPAEEAARLVRTLAEAVHFAHGRGIVHRDLKPANILLASSRDPERDPSRTPESGRLHDAVPKISDFGLAKRLHGQDGFTQTGAVLGTPSYMAPEQAEGKQSAIGPAADVYALGAILYEMLTGRPPFQGATLLDTLDQVRSHDPVPPRLLQPATPRDLEAICLKCLLKDPERRYPSAQALANDLGQFLRGEPVQARSVNALEYVVRLINRNPDASPIGDLRADWLVYLAPIPFLAHLAFYALAGGQPYYPLASLGVTILAMAVVFGSVLAGGLGQFLGLPVGVSRQLWSTRIGHFLGLLLVPVLSYLITPEGRPWDPMTVYPLWATVAGLTFFNLGGWFWGRLYLLGLTIFGAALLMAWQRPWAALILGLMLSIGIGVLGLQLRRFYRRAKPSGNHP